MGNRDDEYSEQEAARRRDEVVRRMANTPPQPKATPSHPRQGKKKKAAVDRGVRKARATREA
jgi:hypothetical protein